MYVTHILSACDGREIEIHYRSNLHIYLVKKLSFEYIWFLCPARVRKETPSGEFVYFGADIRRTEFYSSVVE